MAGVGRERSRGKRWIFSGFPLAEVRLFSASKKLNDDLDEQLRSHIAIAEEENIKRGMSAEHARTTALKEFGEVTQIKECYRIERRPPFLEVFIEDIRYALRQRPKSPGLTLTAVNILSLDIGTDTAIFTLVQGIRLRSVHNPSRLCRTGKIAMRMALSATRTGVVSLLLRNALVEIVAGLVLGILAALRAGHLMVSRFYGVSGYDPFSFIDAIVVLGICAAVAQFISARRAASIDPMRALGTE
jgi:hypothetical protein